jgi:preprotein translocase subunit SecG
MQLAIRLLTFVDVLIALIIIALVLMQRSKAGGGLGGLTGGATEEVFGSGAGNILTKATIWFAVAFFVITLGLAMLQGRVGKVGSVLDDEETPPPVTTESQTAAPLETGDDAAPPAPTDTETSDEATQPGTQAGEEEAAPEPGAKAAAPAAQELPAPEAPVDSE